MYGSHDNGIRVFTSRPRVYGPSNMVDHPDTEFAQLHPSLIILLLHRHSESPSLSFDTTTYA